MIMSKKNKAKLRIPYNLNIRYTVETRHMKDILIKVKDLDLPQEIRTLSRVMILSFSMTIKSKLKKKIEPRDTTVKRINKKR